VFVSDHFANSYDSRSTQLLISEKNKTDITPRTCTVPAAAKKAQDDNAKNLKNDFFQFMGYSS